MQDFKKLKVWEKSHAFALATYRVSATFPKSELYSLTTQIKRASMSVPANIAEGCGRGSNADLARFLYISMGSACETEYYLLLARDLGFLDDAAYAELGRDLAEIKRMLAALIKRLTEVV